MKTQFSREKWLRKKEQKYLVTFEVRRPNTLEICDTHWVNCPDKICFLRSDMMGFILNHANINFDSRVLIVDNTKGLLLGALVEKKIR
jgi:tRNA (adenine-N(1)-)-methyltransferase non-catalytic subunit